MRPNELVSALVDQAGGALAVAKAMRVPTFQGTLHKYCKGKVRSPSQDTVERISGFFRLPVEAFYSEAVAEKIAIERGLVAAPPKRGHPSNPHTEGVGGIIGAVMVPAALTWDDVMHKPPPGEFCLDLRDDAMAPEYRQGRTVIWRSTAKPAIGDVVLLRDRDGELHVRQMRQGPAKDRYLAVPTNPAYATLDSIEHGLQVVAVWDGVRGRFGG